MRTLREHFEKGHIQQRKLEPDEPAVMPIPFNGRVECPNCYEKFDSMRTVGYHNCVVLFRCLKCEEQFQVRFK